MILTRVEIEGVRCFGDPVQVLLSKDGINLVAGPNGSGKSTFIEAVRRCLLDLHTSATASNLAPWADGRAPEITVEFEHGDSFYRLSKRFLKRKSAKLERKKGKSWIVLQEGKEADEEVRRLLRSGGRNDDGLLSVLWSPQGKLPLEGVPGAVLDDLRGALGAQMGHPALEKELGKLYEANFQPSRGLPKKGRLHQIQSQRANVEAAAEGARTTLDTAEEHGSKAAQFRAEIHELHFAMTAAVPLLEDAERKAAAVAELTQKAELHDQEWSTLDAQHSSLWQRTSGIETENTTRDRLVATVPALVAAQERAEFAERGAVTGEAAARDAAQKLSQPDPLIQLRTERVRLAEQWLGLSAHAGVLEVKLAKLAALATEEQQAAAELQNLNAPDRGLLAKIRQAYERLREARVWLEKLELRLELVAETDLSVEVSAGEPSGTASLGSGATFTTRGNRVVALRLPGIATLRVSGPETDADKWQKAADAAEGDLANLCAAFGTDDIADLAERCERRVEVEAELLRIRKGRKELFAGTDQAGFVAELDGLRKELALISEKEPQWPAAAPDVESLRGESETLRRIGEEALAAAQQHWHAAQQELGETRIALQKAGGALEGNRTQMAECEGRLRRLRDDGKTDEQRRQELDDYARRRDYAQSALNEAHAALQALPTDATQRAAELRATRESAVATVQRLDRLAAEHEAAQRTLLSQGPYTSLADAEEEIARLRLEEEREQLRLEAIRTLWITYQAEKLGVLDGLADPVSRRATELLEEFAGRPLAGLQLSVDFSETAISPAELGQAALEEMSGGEQEQILLAVRLALAENLTRSERHMVVLDDVLLNTDDQRLGRILDYFERHKDQMQVVVLTCHPERYSRIRAARLVEFPPASVAVAAGE